MIPKFVWLAAILFCASWTAVPADDLDLNKFQEVSGGKASPAKLVYLKPDGAEGQKGDAGAVPAIKLELSPMPKTNLSGIELDALIDHLVMQNLPIAGTNSSGAVSVDVWASSDFKRFPEKDPNSQVDPGDFNGYLTSPPNMDFWIIGPHHTFFANLALGAWTHVEGKFSLAHGTHLEFHIPPGTGFIYLKNFSAKL